MSLHLQSMESEVNVFCDELVTSRTAHLLLTNQLQRLMMCFDVYVETESENASSMEGPVEFAKERIFSKICRCVLGFPPFIKILITRVFKYVVFL